MSVPVEGRGGGEVSEGRRGKRGAGKGKKGGTGPGLQDPQESWQITALVNNLETVRDKGKVATEY
jgi:hypothetical protein